MLMVPENSDYKYSYKHLSRSVNAKILKSYPLATGIYETMIRTEAILIVLGEDCGLVLKTFGDDFPEDELTKAIEQVHSFLSDYAHCISNSIKNGVALDSLKILYGFTNDDIREIIELPVNIGHDD